MRIAEPRRAVLALLLCSALTAACQEQRASRGDRSERPLDGLERSTARNVSIETAILAMQQRDLKKLKMLAVWVRNRDKTALLGADDLNSLDLAIACLEDSQSEAERKAASERIASGKLKQPALDLCALADD